MINSRLSIYRPAPFYEWVDVGLTNEIPVSTNYAVADIREPDKRNAAWSKTISIPGTKEVNKLFELIFDTNVSLQYFNPNLKIKAWYYLDDQVTFKGNLQLLSMDIDYNGEYQNITYNCSIMGEGGDLFTAMGDAYLTDLDLTDLNHTFDLANTINGTVTNGDGMCYPWIDYGLSGGNGNTWTFEHLKPAVFEREYLKRIFAAIGKTWTSTFLDSAYYKSIIIPCVNEGALKAEASVIENAQFNAGKTADTTTNITGAVLGTNWFYGAPALNYAQASFNDDSSGGFFDPGGVYNTATYTFAPNYIGLYNITAKLDFSVIINAPAGTVSYTIVNNSFSFAADITSFNLGGTIATGTGGVIPNITTTTTFSIYVNIPAVSLNNTDLIKVQLNKAYDYFLVNFKDVGGFDIVAGLSSIDIKLKSTSVFYALLNQPNLNYGNAVIMNDTIPRLVKQRDFFTSILKCENLYIEQDRNNPNNYIIEPRDTFIQYSNPLDWTTKLDISKRRQVLPMGDMDFKNLTYTYKTGEKDYWNVLYEASYRRSYGDHLKVVTNDFLKSEKKTEVIFAPTPAVGNMYNDIVCPKIFQADAQGLNVKPMAATIRRLIWKGSTACKPFTLAFNTYGTTATVSTYNFAGMMNDPYNPTITLDWHDPFELYYVYPGQSYTNNGLYNRNYQKFIDEITDKDSKVVRMWFRLTENDISTFSFRKIVYVDGSYYFVNKIMNYNPNAFQTTECELLKLKKGAQLPIGNNVILGGDGQLGLQNFGGGNFGIGNNNFGNNNVIIGENNFIGGGI